MINLQGDFRSRISARAVATGIIATLALLLLILNAGAVWSPDLLDMSHPGLALWFWTYVSWCGGLYIGSYTSASVGRATTARDGGVHGLAVWSATYLMGAAVLALSTGRLFGLFPETPSSTELFGVFLGNSTALGVALLGGIHGAATESKVKATDDLAVAKERKRKFERAYASS